MNTTDLTPLPPHPRLKQFKEQAANLVRDCKSGNVEAVQRIEKHHPRSGELLDLDNLSATFAIADAQSVIAREHGFESWLKLAEHIEGLARMGSSIRQFETGADAIVSGDVGTLESLLRENPALVRSRSTRVHRASLLHYVGANGFEGYRQKSPKNAVDVAKVLIEAGAEVDAAAEMYGCGATTLGLVATSVHPARAGVQVALIETLLDHGAAVDGLAGGWSPLIAALANHCPEAAETLGMRGARVDNIVPAAALGRLDLAQSYLNEDGSLRATVADVTSRGIPRDPKAQLAQAFIWAGLYGRTSVVEFLLHKGVDPAVTDAAGQTALHWAAGCGSMAVVKLLLEHRAPLEAKNGYGGTVLDQVVWFALNVQVHGMGPAFDGVDYPAVIQTLIDAGARVDAHPRLKDGVDEVLRRHGAKS